MTSELRAFSRKRTGRLQDLPLADALEGAQLILKERLLKVDVAIASGVEDAVVRAGRVRLEQILVNLIQNAAEAIASRPEPRIAIEVMEEGEDDGSMVRLRIRDNGPGLSPAIEERLFTPFTTDREGGLGLGLVIARDIARDMGGDLVHVATAQDAPWGACFELILLRATGEAAA